MLKKDLKLKRYEGGKKKVTKPEKVSLLKGIRQYLDEHPAKLQELVRWYIENKRMRDLLWKMIDGSPRTQSEITVKNTTVQIDEDVAAKYGLRSKPSKKSGNETSQSTKGNS